MRTYNIPQTDLTVSRIAYGCATLVDFDQRPLGVEALNSATRLIHTAYDNGITFFDLADHYGFFKSEAALGEILKRSPGLRNRITLQSKCGVRFRDDWHSGARFMDDWPPDFPTFFFDCSYQNIIQSVEGSLRRLQTDHLDILLLHQLDTLIEPQEVAKAFDELKSSGKVRYFGVSNHTAGHIELLKKYVRQPIVVNQLLLGLGNPGLLADGLKGTRPNSTPLTGVIDYCRLRDITIQAFAPLRGQLLNPATDAAQDVHDAAQVLRRIADQKNTTPWVLALTWLLRHPANIIPVIGSTNPKHIADNCAADAITLDRDDWYRLLVAATNVKT
jgi:predicted oxidoreductase